MHIQRSRLIFGSADINILQSIAVYISFGYPGALRGQHLKDQPVPVKVYKLVFFMNKIYSIIVVALSKNGVYG